MNNIVRRTPALVLILLALSLPLFAAANEVLVGGTAPVPAPGWRHQLSAASNGDQFFVAWADARSGSQAVVGTRVTRTGQVLDPFGIRLESPQHLVVEQKVVWDGSAYLVLWTSITWQNGSSGEPKVYAARVDAEGRLVTAPRVIVERGAVLDAASNGNVSVVIYASPFGNSTHTVILDGNGNPVVQETLPVVPLYRSGFTIAATASGFVVAWTSNTGNNFRNDTVDAVRLDANGRAAGTVIKLGNGTAPSIATGGTRVLIAWHRYTTLPPDGGYVLQARAFDADLSNGAPEQTLLSGYQAGPAIAIRREGRFEVVTNYRETQFFDSPLEVRAIALDADAGTTGSRTLAAFDPYGAGELTVATNGAEMLLATTGVQPMTPMSTAHVSARIVRGEAVEPPVLLSWSGNAHRNPGLAASPSGHLVVWTEDDGVYATRIDGNGNSLDGRGVRLSTSAGTARAAFDGTHYVVALSHEYQIDVRWISPLSGSIAAAAEVPIDLAGTSGEFALATSPQATYIVTSEHRINVRRIPHTTYMPDAVPLAVSPEEMQVHQPAVAWNGSELLVAWNEWYVPPRVNPPYPISFRLQAARVGAGLTLLDPAPLILAEIDPEEFSSFDTPSLASNGADWLVVANRDTADVIARRVLQNGTLEGSAPVVIAQGLHPAVAWDGQRYILAWKRTVEGEHLSRIYTAAVPAAGALLATKRSLVTADAAPSPPAIAATAVAYTKYSHRPEHTGVQRTFLRGIELGGTPRGRVIRR